jgi:murein DD-endopeptidase MepM/ murein hydrolase activator NlpD
MVRITQIIILIGVLSISANGSCADIYRYTAEDGSVCFTNAPGKKNAVLHLRDTPSLRKKSSQETAQIRKSSTSPAKSVQARAGSPSPKISMLPVDGLITSPPGFRPDPFSGETKYHNGIDIAVPQGTPVRPVSSGIVTYSGVRNGYGNIVIVDHEDGLVTLYAHNSQNMVSTGEKVGLNTVIALTGSTGRSTGPHLHFEAWRLGENVTPLYLPDSWGARRLANLPARRSKIYAVRKVVMDDGTVLLTNLPLQHP